MMSRTSRLNEGALSSTSVEKLVPGPTSSCVTRTRLPVTTISPPPEVRAKVRRSEEHTSELQSLMRISYAVFCLKKKTTTQHNNTMETNTPPTVQHTGIR